jgi:hypothetical protein
LDPRQIVDNLDNIRGVIRQCVEVMPKHDDFIKQNCAAPLKAVG